MQVVFNKIQFYINKCNMQRIPFGSPTKENLPSPSKKHKAIILSQITALLKNSGITMPLHIAQLISGGGQSPVKTSNKVKEDEWKRLRVQLSQYEFQLKKVEQDFAEFKRQVKLQKEKESKKSQDQMSKLRSALEVTSEDNTYKLDKLIQEHQAEKKALRDKQKLELQQEVTKVKEALTAKLQNEEKLRKREVAELQRNHERKISQMSKSHEQTIHKLQERSESDLQDLKLKHRIALQEKQKRHQSVRVALESERKTEQKLHQKTKVEAIKEKQKLISQFCFQRNTRCQLQEECASKEKEIRKLKNQIKDLEVDHQLSQQKWTKKINELQNQYETKHQQVLNSYQQRLKEKIRSHQQELSKLQYRLNQMQEVHKVKVQLMMQNAEQLASNFERRPSKPEDLNEIDKLKWGLAKKEQEVRKLSRDLKHCNLQLENKEDIYTRIFRGNSMSRQKRAPPKEDRQQFLVQEKLGGKQTIFRKSQTADMKYLLKIYNNTKNS